MITKSIGKITNVKLGLGGYQDVQFGITISVDTVDGCASTGDWMWTNKPNKDTKWTIEDQNKAYARIVRYIIDLMSEAKVDNVNDLKGKPIEATWNNNCLDSIRILTEVII